VTRNVAVLLGVIISVAVAPAAEACDGLPLELALKDLQGMGLRIIFSSDLVLPTMCVQGASTLVPSRDVLEEILGPHGLTARDGPGGTILVVRSPRGPRSVTPGEIRGVVLRTRGEPPGESHTRALAGTRVSVADLDRVVLCAADGTYAIPDVPPGIYSVGASLHGFARAVTKNVEVLAGEVATLDFELGQAPVFLEEVVVTPSHFDLARERPHSTSFLSREELSQIPHLADDLYRAIGWLPGTSGTDYSARLHIRGGGQDETLVILDGLEIYEPFHLRDFGSLFSVVDSEAVEGLDVITGGFPVEYGDRLSGVVDIASKVPSSSIQTSIAASLMNTSVSSEGIFGGGNGLWLVSLRRGYLEIMLDWANSENNVAPTYDDALAKLQYRFSDQAILSANVLFSGDEMDLVEDGPTQGEPEENVLADDRSTYLWLNLRSEWTPRLFSQTVFSYGRQQRSRDGGIHHWDNSAVVDDERSSSFLGFKQDWTFDLSQRHFLKWGLDAKMVDARYDYQSWSIIRDPMVIGWGPPVFTARDVEMSLSGGNFGAYVADRVRIADPLIAELGLRWDTQSYVESDDNGQFNPRVSLVYMIDDDTSLRAAWGRFSQSQRIDELQVEDGCMIFHPAQFAEHWLVGIEHAFGKRMHFRAEAYYKNLTHVRPRYENLSHQLELFPEVESDRVKVAPERAEAKGVELVLKQTGVRGFSWWLSYVLSSAEDEIEGEMVPRSWDQRHALSFSLNFNRDAKWDLNLSGTFHSGWPRTAVTASFETAPDGSVHLTPSLGQRNAARYPDYLRFDLRVSRHFALSTSHLMVFVEVINLFDRDNLGQVDDLEFRGDGNGNVIVIPDFESWLPFLPWAGVRWTF